MEISSLLITVLSCFSSLNGNVDNSNRLTGNAFYERGTLSKNHAPARFPLLLEAEPGLGVDMSRNKARVVVKSLCVESL